MSSLTRAGFMSCCEELELDPHGFSTLTDKAAQESKQQTINTARDQLIKAFSESVVQVKRFVPPANAAALKSQYQAAKYALCRQALQQAYAEYCQAKQTLPDSYARYLEAFEDESRSTYNNNNGVIYETLYNTI